VKRNEGKSCADCRYWYPKNQNDVTALCSQFAEFMKVDNKACSRFNPRPEKKESVVK